MGLRDVIRRVIAKVTAWRPDDWSGKAKGRFDKGMKQAEQALDRYQVRERLGEVADLGFKKAKGAATLELSEALRNSAEEENLRTKTEEAKRTAEARVRQEEANAEKAELEVQHQRAMLLRERAEALDRFIEVCRKHNLSIKRDADGNIDFVLPEGGELSPLDERKQD